MNLKQLSALTKFVAGDIGLDVIDYEEFWEEEVKPQKVVFTTQRDNRVDDKICLQLSGIAFTIDDPLRPLIPDDTHPNCRCYYTDQATGEILTDISSTRDVKERNKLTDRQRKNYLNKHKKKLTQKKMDLIVDYMWKNEKWQNKKASLEQIGKWLKLL